MLTRKDIKAKILNVRLKHHIDIGPDGPWAEKVYTPPVARAAVDGMYQKVSDGSISGWQWTAAATATAL